MWAIWFSRRKAIHENEFQSPLSTHMFVQRFISDIKEIKPGAHHQFHGNSLVNPVAHEWIPPPPGCVKIKVDGAVSKTTRSGSFSAICRDDVGTFLGASAVFCVGITDPATLETLACREALALAADLSCTRVVIASDCEGVVEDFLSKGGGCHGNIVKEIVATATELVSCSFIHEGRQSNKEAHSLAKHALGLDAC